MVFFSLLILRFSLIREPVTGTGHTHTSRWNCIRQKLRAMNKIFASFYVDGVTISCAGQLPVREISAVVRTRFANESKWNWRKNVKFKSSYKKWKDNHINHYIWSKRDSHQSCCNLKFQWLIAYRASARQAYQDFWFIDVSFRSQNTGPSIEKFCRIDTSTAYLLLAINSLMGMMEKDW